ncbi:ABC transporter substrate-binding protein [Syntrophomonas palmitatica]|uniref:ABC transporter substrate-binding protein n=1 Tax=Syntrophomonas palmitatica TaxID=402877 RepID=UPI001A9A5207|nr:MetQ/NlpA family ABC transporter substrate-binding protein [Syntrophomonas palmitatica]
MLVLLCSLTMAGCSKNQEKSTPEPKKTVVQKTITIGVMPDVESIPFIIAEKNGYFDKEGVKVKLVPFKSAKDRDSALQSGELDGVISDVLAVAFANDGGFKIKITSKNEGNLELMAGKNSGINSIYSLKGKNVGMSTNTIMEYTADKMLEAVKIEPAQVNKIAIPPLPTRYEMLQGGKIDAAILPEPLAGLAVKNGATVLSSTDQMGNKAGAIAFTVKSLQEKRAEIKAIYRAYNDAVDYLYKESPDKYIDFLIEKQGFPMEVRDSIKLPQYSHAELPEKEIVDDVVKWLTAKHLIKGSYTYEDLVDGSVLR